ncbi:DnaJ domain-containing protein, partial [Rhodospirillales bacterium URHD0017]
MASSGDCTQLERIGEWLANRAWGRSMTLDYYALLGVARSAEGDVIRAAYLVLARRYHPDAATAASPHETEKFRLITEAYEVLRDPRRREHYDWGRPRQAELTPHRDKRAPAGSTWLGAITKPLLYTAGAIALVVALVVGLATVISPNGPSADTDLATRTATSDQPSGPTSDKAAHQELTDLRSTLQQAEKPATTNQEALAREHLRRQDLEKQLAARSDDDKLLAQERAHSQELEKQLAARNDIDKLLAQERARSQELEKQLAARGDSDKSLAHERTRSQDLEKQLAARGDSDK